MRDDPLITAPAEERRADPWRFWIFPEYEEWLRSKGYLEKDGCAPTEARHVFNASPRRENAWREDGPQQARVFDKSIKGIRARDLFAAASLHGGVRPPSPPVHEFRMLCHARSHGLRVPKPIACGERRRGPIPREGFIVMEALSGDSLLELLTADQLPSDAALHRVAREVGEAIARLHLAHMSFPSLFSKHVYYDVGACPSVGFLDLADARCHRSLPGLETRCRDFASLCVTLPRFDVRCSLRVRALQNYLTTLGENPKAWRALWTRIAAHSRKMATRKRHRIFASPEPVRLPAIVQSTDGSEIRKEVIPLLAQIGNTADIVQGKVQELPGFAIRRGPRKLSMRHWKTLLMLRQFGVPIPEPMALLMEDQEAALLLRAKQKAPSVHPQAHSLARLILRVLDAGCFPVAPLLPHVFADADGEAHLAFEAIDHMNRPARILKLHRRRALAALRHEIAQAPYSDAHRSDILHCLAALDRKDVLKSPTLKERND
jgi:hypothetical protein